jgi:hypothetical protein
MVALRPPPGRASPEMVLIVRARTAKRPFVHERSVCEHGPGGRLGPSRGRRRAGSSPMMDAIDTLERGSPL